VVRGTARYALLAVMAALLWPHVCLCSTHLAAAHPSEPPPCCGTDQPGPQSLHSSCCCDDEDVAALDAAVTPQRTDNAPIVVATVDAGPAVETNQPVVTSVRLRDPPIPQVAIRGSSPDLRAPPA
jgi:hypothetical protein